MIEVATNTDSQTQSIMGSLTDECTILVNAADTDVQTQNTMETLTEKFTILFNH